MDKKFVRITEWIKGKDPNMLVDIASKNCCVCCKIKDIPQKVKGLWVFTQQVGLMKEALYASNEMRQEHMDSELIWIVDLQPQLTASDLALVYGRWRSRKIVDAALKEIIKMFRLNGVKIKPNRALNDEEIEWVNHRSDDIYWLVDAVVRR